MNDEQEHPVTSGALLELGAALEALLEALDGDDPAEQAQAKERFERVTQAEQAERQRLEMLVRREAEAARTRSGFSEQSWTHRAAPAKEQQERSQKWNGV
jgi:hypothetical protein